MTRTILIIIAAISWLGAAGISVAEGMAFAEQASMAQWVCDKAIDHAESIGDKAEVTVGTYSFKEKRGECSVKATNHRGETYNFTYVLDTKGFYVINN